MAALSRRERSLIGFGVAAALAVGAYLCVVEPLLDRQRETAELTPAREAALERRRLLIAQRERLAGELEAVSGQVAQASRRLLPGPTAPLAASELQKLMKAMAAEASVDVPSERVLPRADLGGLEEIPIELTVAGSIRETVAFLYQIAGASRLLTVKEVRIRLVASGQARELLTTLIVSGYLRPGAVAPRPAERPAAGSST